MPLVNKPRNPVPERYEFSGSLPPPSVRGPFFHRDKESKSWTAHYFVCGHLKNDFDIYINRTKWLYPLNQNFLPILNLNQFLKELINFLKKRRETFSNMFVKKQLPAPTQASSQSALTEISLSDRDLYAELIHTSVA